MRALIAANMGADAAAQELLKIGWLLVILIGPVANYTQVLPGLLQIQTKPTD